MFVNETVEFHQTPISDLRGAEVIRLALRDMPHKPGVYRMLSASGDMLYIGKAKALPLRVSSYASVGNLTTRLMRMVEQVARVEYSITASEAEALLLESRLVKSLKPRYNILLKDDKSFPYLVLTKDHAYPRLKKHRGAQTQKGEYFGPFASVGAVNETLGILQRAFLLRPCSDQIFKNRTRPCLQYQIKRCSAPCVGYISEEDYGFRVKQACNFLRGKNREVQEALVKEMEALSESLQFEKAAVMRDRVKALTRVQQEHKLFASSLKDADVFALSRHGEFSCIESYFYRGGLQFGLQTFFPKHAVEDGDTDILASFLGQFYQNRTPPPLILVNRDLGETETVLQQALALQAGSKVELCQPKRGDKVPLIEQVEANAKAALERHIQARASHGMLLEKIGELFKLPGAPQRIEVYDNSHVMGTHALGAMIVAGGEGFNKKAYRVFNIKNPDTKPGDDLAMMREVLTRRFTRLLVADATARDENWPDLVLIDGGETQLKIAQDVLAEMAVEGVPLVGIAKGADRNAGREWFHLPGEPPFQLPPNDPVLHYLQRLRDEAHRFAIGSHRNKRSKAAITSELDAIPSIGTTRKRALLRHFGSRTAVERATLAELENVEGINKKIARIVYDYFHHG